jgi:peptidoglycan DL-endopeptidase CwlO
VANAFATASFAALVTGGCASAAPNNVQPYAYRVGPYYDSAAYPANDRAAVALAFAVAQVGKRYCWGGIGPQCFDCSGLVEQAWAWAGVRLPRTADAMAEVLREVPTWDVHPGDVLWWPGHVGLYAGGGWQVEALDRRDGVIERPLKRPLRAFRPL